MTVGQKMVLPLKIKNSQILPTGFTVMRVLPVKGRGQGSGADGDDDMSLTSLVSEDNGNDGTAPPHSSSVAQGGGAADGTAADEHKATDQPSAQGQGLDPSYYHPPILTPLT